MAILSLRRLSSAHLCSMPRSPCMAPIQPILTTHTTQLGVICTAAEGASASLLMALMKRLSSPGPTADPRSPEAELLLSVHKSKGQALTLWSLLLGKEAGVVPAAHCCSSGAGLLTLGVGRGRSPAGTAVHRGTAGCSVQGMERWPTAVPGAQKVPRASERYPVGSLQPWLPAACHGHPQAAHLLESRGVASASLN